MRFSLKAALKFLTTNKIINTLIFVTILVGISVQFFIISLSGVLKNIIFDQVTAYQSHININYIKSTKYEDVDFDLVEEIRLLPNVNEAHIMVPLFGILTKPNNEAVPFYIDMIDYGDNNSDQYLQSYGLSVPKNIIKGRVNDISKNEIMLDDSFLMEHYLEIGDDVTFLNPFSNIAKSYTITGSYSTGKFEYLNNKTYSTNNLFKFESSTAYRISVILDDPSLVNETLLQIKNLNGFSDEIFKYNTFEESNEKALELDFIQRAVVGLIQILISVIILIIVINILNYSMQRKYKEIGILKAMGINDSGLRLVFLFQTLIIQIIASILGLLLGTISLSIYHKIMKDPYTNRPRFEYSLNSNQYIFTFLGMIVVSILASFYSYRKVKQLEIIDLIKL